MSPIVETTFAGSLRSPLLITLENGEGIDAELHRNPGKRPLRCRPRALQAVLPTCLRVRDFGGRRAVVCLECCRAAGSSLVPQRRFAPAGFAAGRHDSGT